MPNESGSPDDRPETILCDTSFVSVVQSARVKAKTINCWPAETRRRLDGALLAISVITLAELRDGHIYAGWGERRRQRAEQFISSYLLIPLDMSIVDRCAELRAGCRGAGVAVPDNDIWIAATSGTRGWPLVSCDAHFDLIPDCNHIRLPAAAQ